jgi:hypothetical protein
MTTPQAARDEALERVEAAAHEEWKLAAAEAIASLAFNFETFTSDDVWRILDRSEHTTHERKAMGPMLLNAARDGLIERTGRTVDSRRTACHGRPVRVWRSLVLEAKAA